VLLRFDVFQATTATTCLLSPSSIFPTREPNAPSPGHVPRQSTATPPWMCQRRRVVVTNAGSRPQRTRGQGHRSELDRIASSIVPCQFRSTDVLWRNLGQNELESSLENFDHRQSSVATSYNPPTHPPTHPSLHPISCRLHPLPQRLSLTSQCCPQDYHGL
jgi:hypothetical protein